jgi:hypothetical protein
MAYSQADLDRINKAITAGTLSVEVEGRRVTYRTLDELLTVKAMIERDLNPASPPKQLRVRALNGFGPVSRGRSL